MKGEGTMAELSNKKKHEIIALISIFIIAIIVTVVLVVGNIEKPLKKEKLTEEEILDRCITAINDGDGKLLTYAETFYTQDELDFLIYYYDLLEKYDYEAKGNIVKVVGDGFVDKFKYLRKHFGDEYKITYKVISEKEGDVEFYDSVIDYPLCVTNYGMDMEDHLLNIGVSEDEIKKAMKLYDKASDFETEIKDVNIKNVKFYITGKDKEVSFVTDILYFTIEDELIPCKRARDGEEIYYTRLELTPEFICDGIRLELEADD